MAEGPLDSGWLKVLDVRGPRAFVGLIVCGGVSFAVDKHLFAFAKAPTWVGLASNVGTLLFLGLTLVWLGELALSARRNSQRKRRRREWLGSALEGLSLEEWTVLRGMIEYRQKSYRAPLSDPVAHTLAAKGLLMQRQGVGNILEWVWLMPDDVWRKLNEERALGNWPDAR